MTQLMNRALLWIGVAALIAAGMPPAGAFGEGYGAIATGGPSVYTVTNLNNSGSGSLRDGLSVSGREIRFAVSGTIRITSSLVIKSNTTIDGTSAPGPGITVTGYNTSMSKASNVIVRNIRFRENMTGPSGKCSLQGTECNTVMIDHCSIELGRWDCMSFTSDSYDITVQYCIIGAGIDPQYFGLLADAGNRFSITTTCSSTITIAIRSARHIPNTSTM